MHLDRTGTDVVVDTSSGVLARLIGTAPGLVPVCHRRSLCGVPTSAHTFFAEPTDAFSLPEIRVG